MTTTYVSPLVGRHACQHTAPRIFRYLAYLADKARDRIGLAIASATRIRSVKRSVSDRILRHRRCLPERDARLLVRTIQSVTGRLDDYDKAWAAIGPGSTVPPADWPPLVDKSLTELDDRLYEVECKVEVLVKTMARMVDAAGLRTPAESAPPQNLHPAISAPLTPWVTGPCPLWCDRGGHQHDYGDEDREHGSLLYPVTLTTMDAIRWKVGEGSFDWIMPEVTVQLVQRFREAEARVWLSHGDTPVEEIYLALSEAAELAANLTALIATARSAS